VVQWPNARYQPRPKAVASRLELPARLLPGDGSGRVCEVVREPPVEFRLLLLDPPTRQARRQASSRGL